VPGLTIDDAAPGATVQDWSAAVATTREVGGIRVTGYESKGPINKRIRIEVTEAGPAA
jgi:hypothetical protein